MRQVIEELKYFLRARSQDLGVIDFGMGKSDIQSPDHVVEKLNEQRIQQAARNIRCIMLLHNQKMEEFQRSRRLL